MSNKMIYDMSEHDLSSELVGKSVQAIEDSTIILTDGTVLEIEDSSGCCAWFSGDIEAFDFADNVITGVEEVYDTGKSEYEEAWTLRVFSAHKVIAEVNIEGDSTSGYYCHSVNLRVKGVK